MCYISLDREKQKLSFDLLVDIIDYIVLEIFANYQNGQCISLKVSVVTDLPCSSQFFWTIDDRPLRLCLYMCSPYAVCQCPHSHCFCNVLQ